MPKIEGKIIRILSNREVVINIGSENGVTHGLKFKIVSEGEMIKDPITGRELEKLEIIKGEVVAQHIQATFTICETPYITTSKNTIGAILGTYTTTQDTLTVDEKDVKPLGDTLTVKIGDSVVAEIQKSERITGLR